MQTVDLLRIFNISPDSEDSVVEQSYRKLIKKAVSDAEKSELLRNFHLIDTKEKRYLYSLTSTKGFEDISELDNEIISRPNYIGPRQWLELLE
ncbi:MAG: hypothetical protein KAR21_17285 [Spirochaetales bacterium]|nr:hypothetical protein [Spirochaetales bacterium]